MLICLDCKQVLTNAISIFESRKVVNRLMLNVNSQNFLVVEQFGDFELELQIIWNSLNLNSEKLTK